MNNPTIRLLILNDSASEAERLISMLNNAGKQTRAQHVDSEDALVKLLQSQSWDLLIGLDSTENLQVSNAIKAIRKVNKDVPVILLTDNEGSRPIVDGIKLGAADVVKLDEDQHLLQVIQRELDNRQSRSDARFAERRFKEIERRNQGLLDSSRDGIAFVSDGMFIYANESFAELLDYEDKDDLECMPVIDAIEEGDQSEIKSFMKDFMVKGSEIDSEHKTIKFLTQSEAIRPVTANITKANYDDELCIQLLVPGSTITRKVPVTNMEDATADSVPVVEASTVDPNIDQLTSLYTKTYMAQTLERAIDAAISGEYTGAVAVIAIQKFVEAVQTKIGILASDKVLSSIAHYLKEVVDKTHVLGRFNDHSFMVIIPQTTTEQAEQFVQSYCRTLSEHIVDLEGSTMHLNFRAGVGLFSEMTVKSHTPINNALLGLQIIEKEEEPEKLAIAYEPEPVITDENPTGMSSEEIVKVLQKTIDHGGFNLLFQPILSLRGSDKEHYEVFIRLSDQKFTNIKPENFFDVAQQHGMSSKIDRWVILEAMKLLSKHRANGHNTVVVINLTKDSLLDASLADWLGVAFKAAKLPPNSVIFQLQESYINDHLNIAKEFTAKIKAIGSICCVSHFGCVLSPFKALQHVDVDYVKVDGSFTQELQSNSGEPASLGEIVQQLHELEKITVVPFVESASVLSKLWQSGVHYIQGHYLQAPAESMDYDFDSDG